METILIIISYAIVFASGIIIKNMISLKSPKLTVPNETLETPEFKNQLHPLVKKIYLDFIDKENIKSFQETHCGIFVSNINVEFWAANDLYSRRFIKIDDNIIKEINQTLKEVNDTLSLADQKVLDHIAKAIKINNKEFIERLFI